jgi:putative heme iron utilization protein
LNDSDNARQEFLALRDGAISAHLATLATDSVPEASYAPLVWFEGNCYLFLSLLASHTGNLTRDPEISLMLIQAETTAGNAFARRRINYHGKVEVIAGDDVLFDLVLDEFDRHFGKVMELIRPLPDFLLFRVNLRSGRFIRGFGQAYQLAGENLDQLQHIDPR